MSEQSVAVIEAVTSKEGATNGRAWRKFSVKTDAGDFYSTFDKALAEQAHALEGQRAAIEFKTSGDKGQFRDITAVKAVNGSAAVQSDHGADATTIPSARTDQGGADWDVIGLRKTRCLLWAEYLSSPLAVAVAVTDGQSRTDAVYRFGAALIECAERDIYWRDPATRESDLPF